MKRLLILFVTAAVLFAGCSNRGKTDIVPADAAEKILSEVDFLDTLIEAQGDVAKEWYALDDKVSDFAIYVSGSGATAEEIAVIKSSDIETAKATVEKRLDDLKFRFKDYVPAEMTKLNDPVLASGGDVVILVLADDSDKAHKVVESILK